MALGKNLKRQKLIPSKKEEGVIENKTEERSKKKAAKPKSKTKKPETKKRVKKSAIDTAAVSPAEPITQQEVEIKTPEVRLKPNYISEKEFGERQRVREKFELQLNELRKRKVHIVVFSIATEEFALEIDCIKEVVVTPSIAKIPYAPSYIKGIANIRGFTMIMIDLLEKFRFSSESLKEGEQPAYSVIVESGRFNAGILVENVPTTVVIEGHTIESAGGAMTQTSLDEAFIKGLVKIEDRMIFLIDVEELIESDKISAVAESVHRDNKV